LRRMKASKVTVVDYRTSNLLSITKALQAVGGDVVLTQDLSEIKKAERLVLPGVGAFGAAMRNIDSLGIREALIAFGRSGRPLMGICLGMQLLFSVSFERGTYYGLALLPGEVVAFPESPTLKVPHMGWNQIEFRKKSQLFEGLPDKQYAYFVHSYYVRSKEDCIAGATDYGVMFPAVVEEKNIFGIQFHPEKSQSFGLKILENFLKV
jgi:imidazole glycerol-phosphate synthase subunit HisH